MIFSIAYRAFSKVIKPLDICPCLSRNLCAIFDINSAVIFHNSELSEGELSEGEIPDFDDGLDDNCVGDEADRRKLAMMTEKEREQELFNRMEKREALKTRLEIEQVSTC